MATGRRDRREESAALCARNREAVAAHFLNAGGLAHPADERRQFGLPAVRDGPRLCHDLGAPVLLVPFFGRGLIADRAAATRLAGHPRTLAVEADGAGVTIAIEQTLPADEAVAILDAVGLARIGDYWDMANALAFDYDPRHEVRTLGSRIVRVHAVHAKEYDQGDGAPASRESARYDGLNSRPFGTGQVPARDDLSALRQVGYDGYVVLETGAFDDHKESARRPRGAAQRPVFNDN